MSSGDNGGQQGPQQSGSQQGVTTSTSTGQMVPSSQVQVQVQQQQASPAQQQQQQQQNQQQQQQQIQLQQTTTTTAIHGAQQHQTNHGGNPLQQVLIQQPIQQNSTYLQNLQQLFSQGQILMPSNLLSHNLNSQIQVSQLLAQLRSNLIFSNR